MSGMDRLAELLPCPFCGDNHATTTYTRDGRLVVCTSCGAKSGNYYHGPKDLPSADERAIAAWNRRASQAAPAPSEPVTLTYTNWQGKTAQRTITPVRVWFGSTPWHPEPQWLLTAVDAEKGLERDFALKDFGDPAPSDGLREAVEQMLIEYDELDIAGGEPPSMTAAVLALRAALSALPAQEGEPRHD